MSTDKRQRTNMQLKHIAVNLKGWAISEPFPEHPEGQRIYVRLSGYQWGLTSLLARGYVTEDSLLRQSLELSPEEKGEVTVADSSISEFVIVGYALSQARYSFNRTNPQSQFPAGTAVPPNIITREHHLGLFLVVCSLEHHGKYEPVFYGVIGSGPGPRQAYEVPASRVFFRHEFRSNEIDCRLCWMKNIVNYCNAIVRSSSDFEPDHSMSGRTSPSETSSEADDDNLPNSALATFFDGDSNITNMEAEAIVNELTTNQAWEPSYTIDSKEVRLLHRGFVGADNTIANDVESRVKFFMTAAKRMKTLKSEQEQVNEILKDTMREVKTQEMVKEISLMQNTMGQIAQALAGAQPHFRDDTMKIFEKNWMKFVRRFHQKSTVCLESLKSLQGTTENLKE